MEALLISADRDSALETNSSRYRILTPAKYLTRAGHGISLQNNPGLSKLDGKHTIPIDQGINYSDVKETVLIERNIIPGWIEKLRLSGAKRIVATFDDNYGLMQPVAGTNSNEWWGRNFIPFTKALGLVDLVIVPSLALVDYFGKYCRKIIYVPNYVDDELWQPPPAKIAEKSIGWGGSIQHVESWRQRGLVQALARVLKENPDWKLKMVGSNVPQIVQLFPDNTTAQCRDWVLHTAWPGVLSEFTIGLAPLHGEYDRYRSNLKLVEYGLGRVPWVASFMDPYSRTHVRGGVLVKEKANDWYEALSLLVKDERARQTLSEAGNKWADEYRMSRNVKVYEQILWPGFVSQGEQAQ